jgi:8-oxo-dGTP diphosphatase
MCLFLSNLNQISSRGMKNSLINSNDSAPIKVVAAAIVSGGKVLCAQRGEQDNPQTAFKFEFPGGKIEQGESAQEALKREILEELDVQIEVGDLIHISTHHYDHISLELQTFLCSVRSGEPKPIEHHSLVWANAKDMDSLDWAAADQGAVQVLKSIL